MEHHYLYIYVKTGTMPSLHFGIPLLAVSGTAAFLIVLAFIVLVSLPMVMYLMTLQGTLREISPENRRMPPEQVWLSLIPLVGIFWQYVIVARLSDSIRLEFTKRNIYAEEPRPAYRIGLAFCILISCSVIPYLGFLAALAGMVCWILYWLRVNDYRNILLENPLNYLPE